MNVTSLMTSSTGVREKLQKSTYFEHYLARVGLSSKFSRCFVRMTKHFSTISRLECHHMSGVGPGLSARQTKGRWTP